MIEPVQREFLRDAAVRRLREALSQGLWKETLPSEAVLCRDLHVSRRTIRAAVAQLVQEKWLRNRGRGLSPAILRANGAGPPAPALKLVRYLSPRPPEMNDRATQVVENTLQAYLAQEGFRMVYECYPDVYERFSARRMEALTDQPDTAAWVLLHATRAIQEWFAATGRPCVVTGSCHAGVDLPSVETDFYAGCFHAFHLLAQGGGGHVVFVAPARALRTASEESAVRGFLAAAARFPHTQATVTGHNITREGICESLASLLGGAPRPTGYLVMLPEHTLTTVGFLHAQGVRIPEEASVICRSDDLSLDFLIPSVAHYRLDRVKFGRSAGNLVVDIVRHGPGRSRHIKLLPEFVPGHTLRGKGGIAEILTR